MTEAVVEDHPKEAAVEEPPPPTTTTAATTTEESSGFIAAITPDDDIEPLDIFSNNHVSSSPFDRLHEAENEQQQQEEELVAALQHLGLLNQHPPSTEKKAAAGGEPVEGIHPGEEEESALFLLPELDILDSSSHSLKEVLFLCSSPFASDDDDDEGEIDTIFLGSTAATTTTTTTTTDIEDPRQRGQVDGDDSLHQLQQQLHQLNLRTTNEQLQRQEEELLLQQLILRWNMQEEKLEQEKTGKLQTPMTPTNKSDDTDCYCLPCNLEDAERQSDSQDGDDEQERLFWQEQLAMLQNNNENIDWLLQSLEIYHNNSNPFSDTDPFASLLLDLHTDKEDDQGQLHEKQANMQQEQDEHQKPPEEQPQQRHGSTRPQALHAARPYIKAFGSTICESSPSSSTTNGKRCPSQRECYGHRERILGCDFSPCGTYLATASQDSTVRIWERRTQKLVATLEMSRRYECLRVVWASERWASEQIGRQQPQQSTESSSPYHYILATGGADGVVGIWGSTNAKQWTNYATIDHAAFHWKPISSSDANGALKEDGESRRVDREGNEKVNDEQDDDDDDDKPQIYSLQFIDHWKALPNRLVEEGADDKSTNVSNSFLLTSSDDHLHLWELDEDKLHKKSKGMDGTVSKQLDIREVLSLRFGPLHGPGYGVTIDPVTTNSIFHFRNSAAQLPVPTEQNHATHDNTSANHFGGDRNPDNLIFIFDASYCAANGLLGVALSDGSLRLINGRGVCLKVLQLPGCQSHLTSFCWDFMGERLATTVATGHVITWGIFRPANDSDDPAGSHLLLGSEEIKATCCAVMEGGHKSRRPLFGAQYLENDELLVSWGSDGRLCLWDSRSQDEEIDFPLSILWDNNGKGDSDYPIYAVSITRKMTTAGKSSEDDDHNQMLTIAIAGGGTDGGFLGIPIFLQDIGNLPDDDEAERKDVKKVKTMD
jgi:WD40 repeat protein